MRIPIWLISFIAGIAVFLILSLSINALYWGDDFYIYEQLQKSSIWEFMKFHYLNWDGRFVSLNALIQLLLIKYSNPSFAVLVWSIMLLLSSYFMFRIFQWESTDTEKGFSAKHLPAIGFLFCLQWLGYSGHISETVYWVTGGVYAMGLSMIFGFIFLYQQRPIHFNVIWLVGGSLYGLCLGLMGVIGSFPLLVFLLIEIILNRKIVFRDKNFLVYPSAWAFFIFLGTLINIASPGNFIRASILDTSFQWDAFLMVENFIRINIRYVLFSLPAIATAIMAALLMPLFYVNSSHKYFRFYPVSVNWGFLRSPDKTLSSLKWLLVAVASIFPMLVIPDIAGGRTSVFYMAFLFLWVWSFLHKMIWVNKKEVDSCILYFLSSTLGKTIILCFFLGIIFLATGQFSTGYDIRQQVKERELFLKSVQDKISIVSVKPIVVKRMPFAVFFHDLLDDPYARYYGFQKVVLDTTAVKPLPEYYLNPPW
jgi:hypothetical protein